MAKVFPQITQELQEFIVSQQIFFVATAPQSITGHVNLSPKGLDTLRILSSTRIAYLDLTGSGNETSAHLQENGRITLMFCAFNGSPLILRVYGQGNTVLPANQDWDELSSLFPQFFGTRQIIVVEVTRVQTSCGFSVPLFEYQGERDNLVKWASKKGEQGLRDYRQQKNLQSIDGLPTPLSK